MMMSLPVLTDVLLLLCHVAILTTGQTLPEESDRCVDPETFTNSHILALNCQQKTHLIRGQPRSHYFTLDGKGKTLTVTVTPCGTNLVWSLCSKPIKQKGRSSYSDLECHYTSSGSDRQTFSLHNARPAVYNVTLTSKRWSSVAELHGSVSPIQDVFPQLPVKPQVASTLHPQLDGAVKLTWPPADMSSHLTYCVVINVKEAMQTHCAVQAHADGIPKPPRPAWGFPKQEHVTTRRRKQHSLRPDASQFVVRECFSHKSTYTLSNAKPETRYFADVFLINQLTNSTSAYTGTWFELCQDGASKKTLFLSKETCPNNSCSCKKKKSRKKKKRRKRYFSLSVNSKARVNARKYRGVKFLLKKNASPLRISLAPCSGRMSFKLTRKKNKKVISRGKVRQFASHVVTTKGQYTLTFLKTSHDVTVALTTGNHTMRKPSQSRINVKESKHPCSSVLLSWEGTSPDDQFCLYQMTGSKLPRHVRKTRCHGVLEEAGAQLVTCKPNFSDKEHVKHLVENLNKNARYRFFGFITSNHTVDIPYKSVIAKTSKVC